MNVLAGSRRLSLRVLVLQARLCCNALQHVCAAMHNGVAYEHSNNS